MNKYMKLANDFIDVCANARDPRNTGKVQYVFGHTDREIVIQVDGKEFVFTLEDAYHFVFDMERALSSGVMRQNVMFEFFKELVSTFKKYIGYLEKTTSH